MRNRPFLLSRNSRRATILDRGFFSIPPLFTLHVTLQIIPQRQRPSNTSEFNKMVRQSKKTEGWQNIVLNLDDKTEIKMTVGDLRNIIINESL